MVTFTHASGSVYSGVHFADAPENSLSGDGQQTVLPGAVAFYPHVFVAGSSGQVSLALAGTASPAGNWGAALYADTNCNGAVDPGEPPVTGALRMAPPRLSGQKTWPSFTTSSRGRTSLPKR